MGRSVTPKYVVRITDGRYSYTPIAWSVKTDGKPTAAALCQFVTKFEESSQPGSANAMLGAVRVKRAALRNNFTDELVAEYVRPMFTVFKGDS